MSVTIRDVARESGYSVYTVSSTLNNKGRVAASTREKIQETIRRLGYNPARNIPHAAPAAAKSIGLVIPGDLQAVHPSNYRAIMAAKASTAKLGYDFTMYTEQDIIGKAVDNFHRGRGQLNCDGLIIYCPLTDYKQYVRNLAAWDVPVVLVRRDPVAPGVMTVRDSDYDAVTLAMEHLYGLGHHSIAFYGYSRNDCTDRERAYQDFVTSHNLPADPHLHMYRNALTQDPARNEPANRAELVYLNGHAGLEAHLNELRTQPHPPTAVLCYSDQLAVEAIRSLRNLGLNVPDDFSVAGLNNDSTAVMYDPAITSVNLPAEEMVEAACGLLANPRPTADGVKTILEFGNELIVRKSTGPVK